MQHVWEFLATLCAFIATEALVNAGVMPVWVAVTVGFLCWLWLGYLLGISQAGLWLTRKK